MRKMILAATAALMIGTPALAAPAPSITYTANVYTLPGYALPSASIFEEFDGGVTGTKYNPATQSSGKFNEFAGDSSDIVLQGNVPGQGFTPDGDANKYLAIQNGGLRVDFGSVGVQFFSFVFGSLDAYNGLQITLADGSVFNYLGQQIVGGPAPTSSGAHYTDTGRVSYNANGGPGISSVLFTSSSSAFEIDSLATAAPEPATWGMMILGFGLAGAALRSRRRKGTLAIA